MMQSTGPGVSEAHPLVAWGTKMLKGMRFPHWGLVVLLLLASTSQACACAGEKVRVTVVIILASETGNKVDPKLKCIAREVRKTYPKLSAFHLAKISCQSLPVGQKETIRLVDRQQAVVTVLQGANHENRIRLQVHPPLMGEITYDTVCGKFLPIVTPYHTKKKTRIILAICVRTCHQD
jgi:hypothetical protein